MESQWSDIMAMTLLTALSVYMGQATVFYIVYLFWWNQLLLILLNGIFNRIYKRRKGSENRGMKAPSGFLLLIYWVFIVVVFGFMAAWENKEALQANFGVLFLKNPYFNINLLYMVCEICFFNLRTKDTVQVLINGALIANMIVLHISIILGAFILFGVVRSFPDVFTPTNAWGSILVIAPFLLLRFLAQWLVRPKRA